MTQIKDVDKTEKEIADFVFAFFCRVIGLNVEVITIITNGLAMKLDFMRLLARVIDCKHVQIFLFLAFWFS
jgi:hypothetical protein